MALNIHVRPDLAQEKPSAFFAQLKSKQEVGPKPAGAKGAENTSDGFSAEDVEDTTVLSTAVSLKDEAVTAPDNNILFGFADKNPEKLAESYRAAFRESKSHNLLLERFMANVKLSGLSAMMGLCGVSAEKLEAIKTEVRGEALKEIDLKITQDWAYAKAMLEVIG